MKTLYDILNKFKTDLSADIPDLLYADGLDDFDKYLIGGSRDAHKKVLCIYKDEMRHDPGQNYLTMLFQAQIPGVTVEIGAKYEDIIFDYLSEYEPVNIGMTNMDGISSDTWPMENTQGIIIFFQVSYSEGLDSCD